MPPLLEKLNDAKERVHKPAESCLIDLGNAVFRKPSSSTSNTNLSSSTGSVSTGKGKEKETSVQMYERILVSAFEAKGSRSKVGGMRVLCGVRQQTRGLGLKMFLPLLVAMLEDGDGSVREEAKSVSPSFLSRFVKPLLSSALLSADHYRPAITIRYPRLSTVRSTKAYAVSVTKTLSRGWDHDWHPCWSANATRRRRWKPYCRETCDGRRRIRCSSGSSELVSRRPLCSHKLKHPRTIDCD
jgi:hypothetical protein